MQSKQVKAFTKKYLASHFPDFAMASDGGMIAVPMNHLRRSFAFSRTSYSDTSFYLYVNVMPLYVPADFVYLAISARLTTNNQEFWEWDEQNLQKLADEIVAAIKTQGSKILNAIKSPVDYATIGPTMRSSESWNELERFAYSHIYCGQYNRALPLIEDLHHRLKSFSDPDERVQKWLARTEMILQWIKGEPSKAKEKLQEWETATIANLKLDKFPN